MSNLYRKFRDLISDEPLLVGEVLSIDPMRIGLPDGSVITARGDAAVGQMVFVRDGAVEGQAPALAVEVIEI